MIRSLLVPLDGSTFGEHALPLAATLARRANVVLHLVHVHQIVPPATIAGVAVMDAVDLHLRQDEQAYLADVVRRLTEKAPMQVKVALIDGDVAPALREYALRVDAAPVVMSTHGRGALGRFWLGSVADDLIRELPRPIILIRPHEGKPDLQREYPLRNILLPLDGTPLAEQVLEPALDLGKLFDATFTLVRVVQPILRPSYLPEGTSLMGLGQSILSEARELMEAQQQEAQSYLDSIAARLAGKGCKVQTRVVIEEEAAIGIMLEAQVRHADLIAMETHGRRGLSRMLLGSVADKIVRGGLVPVLLNRPAQNE
jgi:nucleotide-binding universal stress UspA family protein